MHDPMMNASGMRVHGFRGGVLGMALFSCLFSAIAISETGDREIEARSERVLVAKPEPRAVSLQSRLDVGISIETQVPVQSGTGAEMSFRHTEAQLIGAKQRLVFEESGRWGVVRLYPEPSVIPELMLSLMVVVSDGRQLEIDATLTAVTGDVLLSQTYLDRADHADFMSQEDPFADLYHRIHVDVARRASQLSLSEHYLDMLAFLRYARQLLPEAFDGYMTAEADRWKLLREPAEQDPMFMRIAKLRAYELLFVDTIDEQLTGALRDIDVAYRLWLKVSKEQLDWLDRRRERGIDADSFTDESSFARHQAVYAAYRSLKIHEQELFELVLDLESESRSTALEIEDKVVKLEGTLGQQYREWRETLSNIIQLEMAF